MTRQQYIDKAVKSAMGYIQRGTDANGEPIMSNRAYLKGTIRNAAFRYDTGVVKW